MSKALPAKKKNAGQSSTESSSGSTSDSSSSSSSSSGSDSSSSSESESSSDSSDKNSNAEQKKSTGEKSTGEKSAGEKSTGEKSTGEKSVGVQKSHHRKSTEHKSSSHKSSEKQPKHKAPVKVQKQPVKTSPCTSDEDKSKPVSVKSKKKTVAKPKSTATVTPKTAPSKPTGGKVPPKVNPAAKSQQHKLIRDSSKSKSSSKCSLKSDASKKKSIFSPENSSESDGNEKQALKAQAIKNTAPKPRSKASVKPVEKPKSVQKKPEPKVPKSKEIVSSASSASSSTDTSSSSDSESSAAESTGSNKKLTKKSNKKSQQPRDPTNSDTETESKKTTRKLTRSANTRKSKHILGKNVYTDTDSDTESTKRSLSRSPVKRAPVSTKGKAKKKIDPKQRVSEITITEERKCPIEGCDSVGHLGGRQEKHFTVDACPQYHNFMPDDCRDYLAERKKREELRKKIIESNRKSPRNHSNVEQKMYLQKVRESRGRFKIDQIEDGKVVLDKNREPSLDNFVPEYDLKLFRDAQALASEKIEEELKTQPNTKGTKYIEMGKFEMEVWYQSPYPEEFARLPKLYICEYCLRYMRGRTVLQRHAAKCVWRHPPGEEVYRKEKISVWEVDGKRYKQYCQNLCLLAKFFLDHKTLYYDVEPFLFYVMTMLDSEGCHTVGYFSKEKNSFLNYNVSCILTLPPYQRQGYGRLLIDFSYLLTRVEGKIGSPEKPLSDLGLISYRSYWKDVLLGYLCSRAGTQLSVKDISQEMAIHSTDIVSTLQALGMMKYWKGKHIILKKQDVLDEYVERVKRRGSGLKEVDPDCLRWTPFVPPQPNPS